MSGPKVKWKRNIFYLFSGVILYSTSLEWWQLIQSVTHGWMQGDGGGAILQGKGRACIGLGLAHGELPGRGIEYEEGLANWRLLERSEGGDEEGSYLSAKLGDVISWAGGSTDGF